MAGSKRDSGTAHLRMGRSHTISMTDWGISCSGYGCKKGVMRGLCSLSSDRIWCGEVPYVRVHNRSGGPVPINSFREHLTSFSNVKSSRLVGLVNKGCDGIGQLSVRASELLGGDVDGTCLERVRLQERGTFKMIRGLGKGRCW